MNGDQSGYNTTIKKGGIMTTQRSGLRLAAVLALGLAFNSTSAFADKVKGQADLKDVQPAGTTDKEHKNQVYDLTFEAQSHTYTCRTHYKKSMNATDFVVGSPISYEIDGNKVKIKTPQNKKVECEVVRVEQARPAGESPSH
jgi:plastocyanin